MGVLLKFREYEVAVCGDISKMYLRVLIPVKDQHVLYIGFYGENMEVNRDPDTYI